jgi:hypothetical protein
MLFCVKKSEGCAGVSVGGSWVTIISVGNISVGAAVGSEGGTGFSVAVAGEAHADRINARAIRYE